MSEYSIPASIVSSAKESVMAARAIAGSMPAGMRQSLRHAIDVDFMTATHSSCWVAALTALAFALICWRSLPKHGKPCVGER